MLTCAGCGTKDPGDGRFCGECGAPLAVACPSCGAPAAPGVKFCRSCGTALTGPKTEPAPAAPVAERRVCSVLFADLVGFTVLSESRDPEEVRELLSQYFTTARTVIARYGGVVEKFIGDAVMAVWGTPVASEEDAERAVRAGIDLVAAVAAVGADVGAPDLALRAGVVTGQVAVTLGAIGEGMVAGDAVNTAARVQSAAQPGTVWVDGATQRLASAAVGFRDTGEHMLKGKAEPMSLWQATRVLSSVGGAQRVDGLEAPLTGRDLEDRTLRELFHACVDRGAPRLVTVTGPAGAGKSRLGWEFEKYVDGLAEAMWWHRGRCLSYGEGVAFWALAEAVRQRFAIAAEDSADQALPKFLDGLTVHIPTERERSFVGVRLGRLLGLVHPDDNGAEITREDLVAGWRVLFERLADTGPVVLIIEDAQHADDGLLDFVEHVVDWSRQSPIFVVLLGRAELMQRRPGLAGGRNRSSIVLDPLDERSMRQLVAALVSGMPGDAITSIVAQAQGNPLFAVETVRSLIDRDVIVPSGGEYRLVGDLGTLTVPDSLHALLAARLDGLDPGLRSLVADASVLGTRFPGDALAAISDRPAAEVLTGLAELVRREVLDVFTDPLSPERGSYLFSQNMLRQVAYETLSRRDRRARHLAVAEHLRSAFTGGGDEVMDVIAQHYIDALDAVSDETDDEVRTLAVASTIRAAERSLRAGAPARAATSFVRAADLVESDDPVAAAGVLERAGDAFGLGSDFEHSLDATTRARALYLAADKPRDAARSLAANGTAMLRAGRLSDGRAALEASLVDLRVEPDADTVQAMGDLAACATFLNDGGRVLADEAIALAQELDLSEWLLADLFSTRGMAATLTRRHHDSRADMEYAVSLARRSGNRTAESRALANLSDSLLATDPEAAVEAARAAAAVGQGTGYVYMMETAVFNLGWALLTLGEWDDGLSVTSTEYGESVAESQLVSYCRSLLLALRGDLDTAATLVALPEMRASDDVQDIVSVCLMDAVMAAGSQRPAEVRALVDPLFGGDNETAFSSGEVHWAWALGVRAAFDLGDVDEVRRLVAVVDRRPIGHQPPLLRALRANAGASLAVADREPTETVETRFSDAIGKLRTARSVYHLAHGLLDHAEYRRRQGRDAADLLAEAASIADRLGAADLVRRVHAFDALAAETVG